MSLMPFVHEKVVNHLAIICSHHDVTPGEVSSELTQIPLDVVAELLDELEGDGWRGRDRLMLLELLSYDPRLGVKRRIARAIRPDIRHLPAERALAVVTRLREHSRPLREGVGDGGDARRRIRERSH